MADNPTFTNQAQTFSTNANPDIPVRGDADVNGKIRQVVRLDVATGTSESLISAANPLPITGAITGPLSPLNSSTGNAISARPVAAGFVIMVQCTASSTASVLELTGAPSAPVYRGDWVALYTLGSGYSLRNLYAEVESISGATVTLKNPLPFTPTGSYYAKFYRDCPIPVVAGLSSGQPSIPTDLNDRFAQDGVDKDGGGIPQNHWPCGGYDTAAGGKNRMFRVLGAAPSAGEYGLIVRDVDSAAQTASLSVLDDWDETDRAKVNLIAGQVGVQGGSGVVTANTQRVVLATDVTPPLSAGAATEATLSSVDQNIASIIGVTDDAFNKFAVIGGRYDTSKTPLSDGNIGELCLTQYRAAKVCLFDESGNPITTLPVRAPSITWGTVTQSTVSTAKNAVASNASRVALSMWNESGGQIKWTFNGTASATNYQGILNAGQGMIFEGSTNSTQALSIIAVSGTVTYTISEAT